MTTRLALLASPTPQARAAEETLRARYDWAGVEDADLIVALGGDGFLLQVLHMHTIADEVGHRHLLSVPITQHVTAAQKAELTGQKKVALRYNGEIYAVINEPVFFDNRKEEICTR